MCRDGHPEIRHSDERESELCPVCWEINLREAAEARVTELTEALALLIAANKKLFSGVDISLDYIDRMRAALGAQGERP
jgi:hypothetical protein